MEKTIAEILRELRIEKGLSQQQLGELLFVDRSSISNWETGRRIPDTVILQRIARCLDTDAGLLLGIAERSERPVVIMVDDERIILSGGMPILEEAFPDSTIVGFTRPSEAVAFSRSNKVALALLDIELGKSSGLDLCRQLLDINARTNVVFLTAYAEYSLDAWDTGACGFLTKPLTLENVRKLLPRLRNPF